ncbi:C40 family peptidase [Solitalea lacus]|uniref:C40 family peptidase n=1 Tax=Solitalea lacus TaxID=2911172 RepID=UPI001EDABD69|nr:NlpC/P60 family protein [Solitalea lacus]UKJ06078.1 NlpC/P60 family protein [Solitalea lacus]
MENVKTKLYVLITLFSFSACSTRKTITGPNIGNSTTTQLNSTNYSSVKDKYLIGYYAQELGINEKELKNVNLLRFIDDWIGVPYKIGGMTKAGIDCSGFTSLLYKTVYELSIPRTTSQIYSIMDQKPYTALREGDLVFMNYDGKKNSHVGIYLKNGRFVHASTSKGVMISDFNQSWYQKAYSVGGELKK